MHVAAVWPVMSVFSLWVVFFFVGDRGLAPITHRKQALALSCTLNTQEIRKYTQEDMSQPLVHLSRLSDSSILPSTPPGPRKKKYEGAGCQDLAADSADSLSNFSAECAAMSFNNPHLSVSSSAADSSLTSIQTETLEKRDDTAAHSDWYTPNQTIFCVRISSVKLNISHFLVIDLLALLLMGRLHMV